MKPLESSNHGFESTAHLNGSYGGSTCEFPGSKSNGQKVFYFVYHFQINDLPEPVRNLLIKQVTLEEISCHSGTNIKVLGSLIPTDRKDNQVGLKPLYLHIQASKKQNIDRAVQRIKVQIQQAMSLPKYKEKVLIGLESAPVAFDVRGKVLGPGGANLQYITNETGAIVTVRGRGSGFIEPTTGLESIEPLHLCVEHNKYDVLQAGRQLAFNLIETVQQEWYNYQQQNQPANAATVPQHINTQQQGWQEKSSESRFSKDYPQGTKGKIGDLYDPAADSEGEADAYGKRATKRWDERSPRDPYHRSSTTRRDAGGQFKESAPVDTDGHSKRPGIDPTKYASAKRMKENGFESSNTSSDPQFNLTMGNTASLLTAVHPGLASQVDPLVVPGSVTAVDVRTLCVQPQRVTAVPVTAGAAAPGFTVPSNYNMPPPLFSATPARPTLANNIVITGNNQFYPPVTTTVSTTSNESPLDTRSKFNLIVVSENYPEQTVLQENFDKFLDRLSTLITQMDAKRDKVYPAFKSITLENGVICASCKSEETKKWLEKSLPLCTIDWDVGLKVMNPSYLPNLIQMISKIPGSKPRPDVLLKQLANQNSHIDTSKWGVVNVNEIENGCWAIFSMDDSQEAAVAKNNFILNYRFAEISLQQFGNSKSQKWFTKN